jgi:hypothetical protein
MPNSIMYTDLIREVYCHLKIYEFLSCRSLREKSLNGESKRKADVIAESVKLTERESDSTFDNHIITSSYPLLMMVDINLERTIPTMEFRV